MITGTFLNSGFLEDPGGQQPRSVAGICIRSSGKLHCLPNQHLSRERNMAEFRNVSYTINEGPLCDSRYIP